MDLSSSDKTSTAIKVPTFSGKKADYPIWWMRFRSHARVHNFIGALSDTPEKELPSTEHEPIDESTDSGKASKKALNRNAMAVACLSMALQADDDLKLVMKSITSDWPGGRAHIIVKGLFRNYKSENIAAKMRIRQDVNKISMTNTMNPKILRKKISQIENRHNHELADDDLVAIVIEKAAPIYSTIVATEQRAKGSALTPDDLIDAMMTQWNLHHDEDDDGEDGTESSLDQSASGGLSLQVTQTNPVCQAVGDPNSVPPQPFVVCNFCQEPGHGYYQCPLRSQASQQGAGTALAVGPGQHQHQQQQGYRPYNGQQQGQWRQPYQQGDRPRPYCEDCKVYGHSTQRCWENPANAQFRPPNWTSRRNRPQQAPSPSPPTSTPAQDIATVVASNTTTRPTTPTTPNGQSTPSSETRVEMLMSGIEFPHDLQLLRDPNIWIADTGATQHMTSHTRGLINLRRPEDPVSLVMANDTTESATVIGDLPGMCCNKYGCELRSGQLSGVNILPSAAFNLFSISKMLKQGWSLSGSSEAITITKGSMSVTFDIVIPTPDGMIFCLYFKRKQELTGHEIFGALPDIGPKKRQTMSLQDAHDKLGHIDIRKIKPIVEHLGFQLQSGEMEKCAACAAGKARRKNLPRSDTHASSEPEDPNINRIYLDMSSVRPTKSHPTPRKNQWRMIVHGKTQLKFSAFYESKKAMVEPTCEFLHRWESNGLGATHVRLDNAGENILLQSRSQSADWKLNLNFEFTARNTPQQNSLAEVAISTIAMRGRAMMHRANVPMEYRSLLWTTAFDTATLLDGLVVIELDGVSKTRYEHWSGQLPRFAHHLRTWGEAGTVKTATDTTQKLEDKGTHCIFVGYCRDHAGDVYRMFNPHTKKLHVTRDVIWLRRMYFLPPEDPPHLMITPILPPNSNCDSELHLEGEDDASNRSKPFIEELEDDSPNQNVADTSMVETIDQATDADENVSAITSATPRQHQVTRTGRHIRPPRRLIEEYQCAGINYNELSLTQSEINYYSSMAELGHEDSDFSEQPESDDSRDNCDSNDDDSSDYEEIQEESSLDHHSDISAAFLHADLVTDISNAYQQVPIDSEYQAPEFPVDCEASGMSPNSSPFARECALVGAGLGGGIQNTRELHVLTYEEAINGPERDQWLESIEKEYQRMIDNGVFIPCDPVEVPADAKILSNVWAMKKKASGAFRARLNARGYEQVDGEHYDSHATFAPVASEMTIMIIFVLIILANWVVHVMDVKGAFLLGDFEKDRKMWMTIPKGMESKYPPGWLIFLGKTLYGTKQAARAFWNKVQEVMKLIQFLRNRADPCLYFAWTAFGLVIWLSWVDDFLVCGSEAGVLHSKEAMKEHFDCDDCGELTEYIGCKVDIDREQRTCKFSQPVLLQSFFDEFDVPSTTQKYATPAAPGEVLKKDDGSDELNATQQSLYRSGVGKLLHLMKWSRPDILNSVRELSKFMKQGTQHHLKAMYRVMRYCMDTPSCSKILRPVGCWDGTKEGFEFVIRGRSDSDFAKDPDKRHSVSGISVFLQDAPISESSRMQDCVTLSVSEAKIVAAVETGQRMLFGMRVLEQMGLTVQKPMILQMDCKGAIALTHSWSVGGRTRHIDVKWHFLREMKEEGIIHTVWLHSPDNSADLFTKNLSGPDFRKHVSVYCSNLDPACNADDDPVTPTTNNQGAHVEPHHGSETAMLVYQGPLPFWLKCFLHTRSSK